MPPSIQCPAIAISPAGWHKVASEMANLVDASPTDDLAEWQRLEIVDAQGMRFVVSRAFRAWPKHPWGAALCRILNQSIHVGFEFSSVEQLSLAKLTQYVSSVEELPSSHRWSSPREVMEFLCG